jgi:DNA-binding beta-propeller fold protein YncE
VLAGLATSLALVGGALSAATPAGGLRQLAGANGCLYDPEGGSERGLHEDLPLRCGEAAGLDGAFAITTSRNGRHIYIGSFSGDVLSAFTRDARTGIVRQLPGTEGCVIDADEDRRCATGFALDGVSDVAVSPDGRHVYVASFFSHAVVAFARDAASGSVSQLLDAGTCVGPGVVHFECGDGRGMFAPSGIAISPDGRHVYVASVGSDSVAVLSRDRATGALRQLQGARGCIRELPEDWPPGEADPTNCGAGNGLELAVSVAVSPDGKNVYVASFGQDAVSVFARDRATGALTQLPGAAGCVSDDGTSTRATCLDGRGLRGAFSVTISPDGKNVYVASGFDIRSQAQAFATSGVAVFARLPNGRLRQLAGKAGCVSETGSGGQCANGVALEGAEAVAVSRDGRNVYVAATASDALTVFSRDQKSGRITQLRGRAGCISETGTFGLCADGVGLWGISSIVVSPDGRFAYAPGFYSSAVSVFSRPVAQAAAKKR